MERALEDHTLEVESVSICQNDEKVPALSYQNTINNQRKRLHKSQERIKTKSMDQQ